jgi:hypothetical protein
MTTCLGCKRRESLYNSIKTPPDFTRRRNLVPMERACLIIWWLGVLFVATKNIYGDLLPIESATRVTGFSVFEENGKVGLKDEEGQILIPASYEAIGWSNGSLSIVDKVVGYQSEGLWGIIHTSNKRITPAEFLELNPAEGPLLLAKKKSNLSQRPSFGVINTAGKVLVPFHYDGLQLTNMRAVVMSRQGTRYTFGLIDISNKNLIPLEYQRIYSLGSLRYAVENFESKTAIFSDNGTQLTNFLIDSISTFKKDHAIIYENQRQGLIDRNGQVLLPATYGEIRISDRGVEARDPDSWYLLNGQNKLIREYQAEEIKSLSPYRYLVKSGGKCQLTDNRFQPLHEGYFSSLHTFTDGVAVFTKNGRSGAVDTTGKLVLPAHYQQLILDDKRFLACLDANPKNRWVVLDWNGATVTDKNYEAIAPFNGKFFPVKNRGFWGGVNAQGKEIIACVHDSLVQQTGNHVVVKFRGEYGIINLQEDWIITPQANGLKLLNDDVYLEFAGKTTFLKSLAGEIIYFSDYPLEFEGQCLREYLPSGKYWLVDLSGIITDRPAADAEKILPESEGLQGIYRDGKYGFIDQEGRLRIANRYEDVRPFSDGLAAIRIRNLWGFIDQQEKLVVQPVYNEVENFHKGVAVVKQNRLSGLVDQRGKVVLPLRYEKIIRNGHERFLLWQEGLIGLADATGSILIHPKYDQLVDTGNGYVIVNRGGKSGLLTLHGVSTIPLMYDDLLFDPHHQQYMALKRSPWEIIDGQSRAK